MRNRRFAQLAANEFRVVWPGRAEWWRSVRWVLMVFTFLVALTLIGSFVSYERVVSDGHPWLPTRRCPGCFLCGMTRSFCAMSSGRWQQASEWNHGGPVLYTFFWLWLSLSGVYGFSNLRKCLNSSEIQT